MDSNNTDMVGLSEPAPQIENDFTHAAARYDSGHSKEERQFKLGADEELLQEVPEEDFDLYSDDEMASDDYDIDAEINRLLDMDDHGMSGNLTEGVNIEEAEVVMATRSMVSTIQDQIEKIGRMINEEIPAISEQVQSEMGREVAQSYAENVSELLNTYLEEARAAKEGMERAIAILSGEEVDDPMQQAGGGRPNAPRDKGPSPMDHNQPAAAGPRANPLGRAKV